MPKTSLNKTILLVKLKVTTLNQSDLKHVTFLISRNLNSEDKQTARKSLLYKNTRSGSGHKQMRDSKVCMISFQKIGMQIKMCYKTLVFTNQLTPGSGITTDSQMGKRSSKDSQGRTTCAKISSRRLSASTSSKRTRRSLLNLRSSKNSERDGSV